MPHGGQISSYLSSENVPRKLVHWYDNYNGKQSPPKDEKDLADPGKVQYSVAEQIKAANLSFRSIESYCHDILKKKISNWPAFG